MLTAKRCVTGATLLIAIALALGCASAPVQPPPPPPSIRLAVLDFSIPDQWRDPEAPDRINKDLQGWWFGSRDVWRNPGMGRVAADIFSSQLNRLPFITTVSRVDIKYYMADKREHIRRLLDERRRKLEKSTDPRDRAEAERIRNMTEADYERELERLPPRDVGRALKADRVLVGRIHDAYLGHNRTIHWYWSYVDLELNLVDVDTGRVVWHKRAQFKKNFASVALLFEIAARRMIEMMEYEYFYQQQ